MENVFNIDIINLIKRYLVLLVLVTIVSGVAVYQASFMLPNQYSASTSMYILRQGVEEQTTATAEELSYANTISGDVMAIMNSSLVRNEVAKTLRLGGLGGYSITTVSENSSRLVTLSVTGPDAELVAKIANAVVQETAKKAVEIMNIKAINVVDAAVPATYPSGPDHRRIALQGAALGLALAFGVLFVREAVDTRVRDGEEAAQLLGMPVVGQFARVEK